MKSLALMSGAFAIAAMLSACGPDMNAINQANGHAENAASRARAAATSADNAANMAQKSASAADAAVASAEQARDRADAAVKNLEEAFATSVRK
jgi:hypothetical protein